MSISTRGSVVSIKEEVSEGVLVGPAAAADYVAIQDDFEISPEIERLENAELKGSLAPAKGILGTEAPTANFSHYLRASGTVGTAPGYGLLLKSAFGAVATQATERDTVAASTVSLIKVDTGEGAEYQRGQPLLIKDPVNGTRIRAVESVSGDDLTLGFNVPTAPGAGVNLGRAVLYYPINEGHPTLSLSHYLGNGGAVQALAGGRVTEVSIEINAGELINASYSVEGINYYLNPLVVTAGNQYVDFTDDDGTVAALVQPGIYTPKELAQALTVALNAVTSETHLVTYSDATGRFTFTASGTVLSLLWNTGTNAANTIGGLLGFNTAADSTGNAASAGYTSATGIALAAPHTPSFDNSNPLVAKDNEVLLGNATDFVCFKASTASVTIATPKANIESVCARSGIAGSIVSERTVTISITALLEKFDMSKYNAFKENANVKFQYSFGSKTAGAWDAGKSGAIFAPTCTISSFNITDEDGLATLEMELEAYADDLGRGEIYLGFV